MSWTRVRDKNGRFSKSIQVSQGATAEISGNMSADKRPCESGTTRDSSITSSPSVSPLRKKSLAEVTASWRSPPNFASDFYPQYMRRNQSPAPSESPSTKSIQTRSPSNGSTSHLHQEGDSSSHSKQKNHSKQNQGRQDKQVELYSAQQRKNGEKTQRAADTRSLDTDTDLHVLEHLNHDTGPRSSQDQALDLLPKGDFVAIRSSAKGQFIHTGDLEEVMSRAMSKVMVKLDTITTDLKQVPIIKAATAKLGREMIQVRQDCYAIKDTVKDLSQKERENSSKHDALASEVRELKALMDTRMDKGGANHPSKSSVSESESLKKQAAARKNNLIIEGVGESQEDPNSDESTDKQIKSFFTEVLLLPKFEIASAFRLGKRRRDSSRPRPIKVLFSTPIERDMVWRAKSVLAQNKDVQYSIKEDLPPKLRTQMSALIRVSQIARKYPEKYHGVRIYDFKIYVNGSVYAADELESLPPDLRPSVTSTPGNTLAVIFYGRDSKFSNHFQCRFTWDNIEFSSIEQYLAFRRACIAGRKDLSNQAMRSQDPADAKRLMHVLKQLDSEPKWLAQRQDILFSGLMAKFTQNDFLLKYLMESGNRQLGEASTDTTWGIGRPLTDQLALDPSRWIGDNLLGTTMMKVREELKEWTHSEENASSHLRSSSGTHESYEHN